MFSPLCIILYKYLLQYIGRQNTHLAYFGDIFNMSADKSGLETPSYIGRQNICDKFTICIIRATDRSADNMEVEENVVLLLTLGGFFEIEN
jgi:hypothetical protein